MCRLCSESRHLGMYFRDGFGFFALMFFFHHFYYSIFLFLGDSELLRNCYSFVCNVDLIRGVGRLVRQMFCFEEIGKFCCCRSEQVHV